MNDTTTTASSASPAAPSVTRIHPPLRLAIGSALLGTLVITGPWAAPAAGHEGPAEARGPDPYASYESRQPQQAQQAQQAQQPSPPDPVYERYRSSSLYDVPFGPYPEIPEDAGDDGRARDADDDGEAGGMRAGRRDETAELPPDFVGRYPDWAVQGEGSAWTTPVTGFPITAAYGTPGSWAAGYHTGVDFAVPTGTPVRAVGPGTVVTAEYNDAYGNLVVIKMTDGYYTLYAHLSAIDVRLGQQVKADTKVGDSGNTGNSSGPHLHFEVRAAREYGSDVDPLAYLAGYGAVLD